MLTHVIIQQLLPS